MFFQIAEAPVSHISQRGNAMKNSTPLIFASDFDGTFYFEKETVPFLRRDLDAIRAFREQGGLFGVCTGRSLLGVLGMLTEPVDFDFYILSGGALILDKDRKIIYQKNLRHELAWEIAQRFLDRVEVTMLMGLEKAYVPQKPGSPIVEQVHSLQDILDKPLCSISMITPSVRTAAEICRSINESYGDEVRAFENTTNVDLVPLGCTKGKAIGLLRQHYGGGRTFGIGDSYNDIPMLEGVDRSFSFHRAPEPVRAKAHTLVDTLADALEIVVQEYK